MIQAPNMLIIGAAGRNVGKTEFACEVIRQQTAQHQVVAVKITTIQERDGLCPRGGKGCGVCTSLNGHYLLTDETMNENHVVAGKDTVRLRTAGAQQVLWLRVLKDHLEEGLSALLKHLPPASCIICESNSARLAIEPGVFLVIRENGIHSTKASCASVIDLADRVVIFLDNRWDMSPSQCQFLNGCWHVSVPATAAILAGGQSTRMGRDKSLLPVKGTTLLEHIVNQVRPLVDEILIGASENSKYEHLGVPVVSDLQQGLGPLMGILSCLQASRHERVLVIACDIPVLPLPFLQMILRHANQADIVLPRNAQGHYEPLLAVYTKRVIPPAKTVLERGGRRIIELCDEQGLRVHIADLPPGDWYQNWNTPDDYRRAMNDAF